MKELFTSHRVHIVVKWFINAESTFLILYTNKPEPS